MSFQLRANHLTVSRMLLLPVPCYLLFGGQVERLISLVLFTVLALTDWLDGKLARKQGPTVLGGLLDPIADKMFLAFSILPMVCIVSSDGSGRMVIPVWVASVIFFRELLVTGLRSISAAHGIEFQTSVLAKFKTAFQMGGSGVLFWVFLWQEHFILRITGPALLVVIAASIALYRKAQSRVVGAKVWTQLIAYLTALACTATLQPRLIIDLCLAAILGLTVLSGGQYVLRVVEGMREKGWPARFGEVALTLIESVAPVGLVALLSMQGVPVWAPIAMLTAELAVGGVGDLLAKEGVHRRAWLAWLRCLGLLACGGAGWAAALGLLSGAAVALLFWAPVVAAIVSGLYCAGVFIVHRKVYMR